MTCPGVRGGQLDWGEVAMVLAVAERTRTGQSVGGADLARLASSFEDVPAEALLGWAVAEFAPDVAVASSFGGPSGMVLLHMIAQAGLAERLEVYYLDTGLLFPETHAVRHEVERRYGIKAVAYKPAQSLEEQAASYGDALWSRDPDLCCSLRKVDPNSVALEGKRCWITGVRRDQGISRKATPVVAWDDRFGLVKVNPLARWTEAQVWDYVRQNDVPYNRLHDDGYPSLGCTVCTRRVAKGDDPRSGRWTGFAKTECGLHLKAS